MVRYSDFKLEQYVNTNPVGRLGSEDFYFQDIVLAMELGKLNGILRGPKSTGKTQLMRDVCNGHFGGEKHSLWETGRTDFRPKDLFERLNLSVARGAYQSLPEIKPVFKDGKVSYLINTHVVDDLGQVTLRWGEISGEAVQRILEQHSTTTDKLTELKNLDKNFFAIDEYNRCPEIVMNLFYGLMTGEINHDGLVKRLGDGYYAGLAAVNPEDYEGTFKMDAAMWARFHVVLDFGAYPITVTDKDELNRRNLSPDVHNSTVGDLSSEIFAIYQKIKEKKLTIEERVILQYLQSGLDRCTKTSNTKELIDWPRYCNSENCSKQTELCGKTKGLDARAIRAVYRLAKGLEEVAKLKKDSEDLHVDPAESFSLAFEFVAPYKGILHPKDVKEARGTEAIVLREVMPSVRRNLNDVIESIRKAKLFFGNNGQKVLPTRENFKKYGAVEEYDLAVDLVEKEFRVKRKLSFEEVVTEVPDLYEEKLKKGFLDEIDANLHNYEDSILKFTGSINEDLHKKLIGLKDGVSKEAYEQLKGSGSDQMNSTFEGINERCRNQYIGLLKKIVGKVLESSDTLTTLEKLAIPQNQRDDIVERAKKQLPDKEIEFIPEDKKLLIKREKEAKLTKRLSMIIAKKRKTELEDCFSGEKFFLKDFLRELTGNDN